jgi:hypothetical protein
VQQVLLIGVYVPARACACMCVSGRVGVRMRICVYSLANPAFNAYAPCYDVICALSVFATFLEIIS